MQSEGAILLFIVHACPYSARFSAFERSKCTDVCDNKIDGIREDDIEPEQIDYSFLSRYLRLYQEKYAGTCAESWDLEGLS